jgi:periplasmic divalent cation tolerance protein
MFNLGVLYMNDYCMVEVCFSNIDEVNKITNILLDKKLVASCHVIQSNSSWNWNKVIESGLEYILQMKTKKSMLNSIYEEIKSIHSYECFEFAIYDITSISSNYSNWIDNEVRG